MNKKFNPFEWIQFNQLKSSPKIGSSIGSMNPTLLVVIV